MGELSTTDIFAALLALGLLVLVGKLIRSRVGFFRAVFLPSSIVAGTIGLLLGPEVLGRIAPGVGWWGDRPEAGGFFPESTLEVWAALILVLCAVLAAGWGVAGIVLFGGDRGDDIVDRTP
jgi:glutamate:Na+ symporter, ESS family